MTGPDGGAPEDGHEPSWMDDELLALSEAARVFLNREAVPHLERWSQQRHVDRDLWRGAGRVGLLCMSVPEQYGGAGGTIAHDLVVFREQARILDYGFGNPVHSGVVAPYLLAYGTPEQRQRWLPGMVSGELVGAIAMTEPEAGSDLAALSCRAVREGEEYVLSGTKTFITNGGSADLVLVVARTAVGGAKGLSLFMVEAAACPGLVRGRVLDKLGQHAADTAELFLNDVRVPAAHRIGREGDAFGMLMRQLPQERLIVGLMAAEATAQAVLRTCAYTRQRRAFGRSLFELQHVRFELAECATLARVSRVFADSCVERHLRGDLDTATASMAKYWLTDVQCQVIDRCLQLHGGNGYMRDYPISRMFADARAQRIYGGANEVMREVIARSL